MTTKHFLIKHVAALDNHRLGLSYADGEKFVVDITPISQGHPTLARLEALEVFRSVKVGDFGASVVWADDDALELASDNLRARAIEQMGGFSHEFIWNWMAKYELSLDDAAIALGLSRRMIAYYRSGEKPVPKTVALACIGFDEALKIDDLQFALAA
jgi:hypothetical protein